MTPLKVLIVEDVVLAAMDLCRTLEKAGHTVTGMARTFQDAVQATIAPSNHKELLKRMTVVRTKSSPKKR